MISHAIPAPGTPIGFSLTRISVENTFSVDAGRVSAPMVSEFFYELHICNFDSILYAQVTPLLSSYRINGQLQIFYHNFNHIRFCFLSVDTVEYKDLFYENGGLYIKLV